MSNIYNLEPPTKGKVSLRTTLGDIDIELWPKEAPKAVRNFVQLCLEGYYDDTIFHRVIKDYMAQGGDPTGTGSGGEPIYGDLFKDEFHQRLKFNQRGLVACANQNQPHTNGSQFFVTLDKCEWLDRKNTIFGKVVGDTIYNLTRFNEVDTDADTDRPYEPPVIKSCEVLDNPFDDIIPRRRPAAVLQKEQQERDRQQAEAQRKAKPAAKAKNLALLSFEAEEEGEEEQNQAAQRQAAKRIKAAHDVLQDARLVRGEDTPAEERIDVQAKVQGRATPEGQDHERHEAGDEADDDFAERMRARVRDKQQHLAGSQAKGTAGAEPEGRQGSRPSSRHDDKGEGEDGEEDEEEEEKGGAKGRASGTRAAKEARERREEELAAIRREKRALGKLQSASVEVADAELLKPWQLSRQKYIKRRHAIGTRQKDTLSRLSDFTSLLRTESAAGEKEAADVEPAQEAVKEGKEDAGYAGKVREDIDHKAYMPAAWRVDDYLDGDHEDTSLADLRAHTLAFAKAPQDVMARKDNADDYVVFDPLLEAAKGKSKFSKKVQQEKKRKNEWAGKSNV